MVRPFTSRPPRRAVALCALLVSAGLSACDDDGDSPPGGTIAREALLDSKNCQVCHPTHYDQWAASMHAYAAEDPVFIAMNRRGQRETGGALGSFCVNCHAPMAVREGLTTDGLNLAQVPEAYRGVTCTFCHSIESVTGTHNAQVALAKDAPFAMLGPIADPIATAFHGSRYAPTMDSTRTEAAAACGACHDIVNQQGTHIERTYAEWQGTVFARIEAGVGCASCHMLGSDGEAAEGTGVVRRIHDHGFPGVDVALTPWPGKEEQRRGIERDLGNAIQAALCYDERNRKIEVVLDNAGVGHAWPSGAAQDRRAWLEVTAYQGQDVIYQSGVVPAGTAVEDLQDPDLLLIRDCIFDATGKSAHMFWEAASVASNLLAGPAPPTPAMPVPMGAHVRWELPVAGSGRQLPAVPDRIAMRVRIKPVGDEVLRDLVASGDLDAAIAAAVPTIDVPNTAIEWTLPKVNFTETTRGTTLLCVAPPRFRSAATTLAVSHARCVGAP